jgi:hypothetical protein
MSHVQKFRSVEDMARAAVITPPGEGFERFARHCARYLALAPRAYPRGVFRFRTVEEAQAARDRVTAENAGGLQARSPVSSSVTLRLPR